MHISGNPGTNRYRRNFKDAKITLDGKPVRNVFEADSVAGYVKCLKVNSDGSIVYMDANRHAPAFDILKGKVRVSVAMVAGETPCELARLQKTKWWEPLI